MTKYKLVLEALKSIPDIGKSSDKWKDRKWAMNELRKHLIEVKELMDANDPHFENELADLTMISAYLVDQRRLKERYKKFVAKGRLD